MEQMRLDLEKQKLALEADKVRLEKERLEVEALRLRPPTVMASPSASRIGGSPAATARPRPSMPVDSMRAEEVEAMRADAAAQAERDALAAKLAKVKQAEIDAKRAADVTRSTLSSALESKRSEFGRAQQDLEALKKERRKLDVCFVMDATGSMGAWINAVAEKVVEISETLMAQLGAKWQIRLALVAYRDHCDKDRLETCQFTSNAQEISLFARSLKATGGGDTPEDVLGGLDQALTLSWESFCRCIIWFGDAPCHGKQYHSCDDSYPDGDPKGLTPGQVMHICRSLICRFSHS